MKINKNGILFCGSLLMSVVMLTGCAYNEDYFLERKEQFQVPVITRNMVEDMSFAAKGDVDAHKFFKKFNLGFAMSETDGIQFVGNSQVGNASKEKIKNALKPTLQTLYVKCSRFNVYSIYNTGGHRVYDSLSDLDAVKLPAGKTPELDRIVSLTFTVTTDTKVLNGPIRLKTYTVRCNYNEINASAEDGAMSTGADYCEGYSYIRYNERETVVDDEKYILDALEMAAEQLYRKLYNRFLPGGRIIGMLGENMTLDKGTQDGISENEQMQVYTIINDTVLPLAYATAIPKANKSNLQIWRWNDDNKFAKQIIRQMQNDINFYKTGDVVYAISLGVPKAIRSSETKK